MSDEPKIKMPEALRYTTVDEVAECVGYWKHLENKAKGEELYRKLWGFLEQSENKTPLGGDGSNGTVEEPYEQLSNEFGDKIIHWWGKLTEEEQRAIRCGVAEN